MNIGKRVNAHRKNSGLSIAKLAAKTSLSPDYIWKIENDKAKNIGLKTLTKIACAFGVKLHDLICKGRAA
jgi:transcriptional regulator with XRE-family HTH domain